MAAAQANKARRVEKRNAAAPKPSSPKSSPPKSSNNTLPITNDSL